MGNSHRGRNQAQQPSQQPGSGNLMKCPRCNFAMPPGTSINQVFIPITKFADHIRGCLSSNQNNLGGGMVPKVQNENEQYEKVPLDYTMTKFKWQKKPIKSIDRSIINLQPYEIKKLTFQEKQYWFRNKIQKLRISWEKGADYMKLQRSNILMCSFIQAKKVNMHKQVKIEFLGEKVNDAGGLLREWIHMVFKEVFDDSTGIFLLANTDDVTYKLKWDEDLDDQFSVSLFQLFGLMLGKAIFQKIPIDCYLDRTILRQLCDCSVKMEDIYSYDKDLYKAWTYILEQNGVEQLDTYFVINKNMGDTIQQIQLVEGGKDLLVTDKNKFHYVDLSIQVQTMEKVKRSIDAMKRGLAKVIPSGLLEVFQPYEVEMILNGIPFINLDDWRKHTIYQQPYTQNHKVIQWFWLVMQEFDQDQLAKILHFCTGSSRTPIHGFKKLQSNRGNYSKFLIVAANFQKTNPFPKGHTCFNRLQLPLYPNKEELKICLTGISKSNLDGVFGLD